MSDSETFPDSNVDHAALIEQCLACVDNSNLVFAQRYADDHALARRIAWIVNDNARRGRTPQHATPHPKTGIPDSYINEVLSFLHSEEPVLQNLISGDEEAWSEILDLLSFRAYRYLQRRGIDANQASQLAPDFAQACAVTLWEQAIQRFPYDTYFNAWVSRIVAYEVSQWWRSTKEQRLRQALSLDFVSDSRLMGTLHDVLPDLGASRDLHIADLRIMLGDALQQISSEAQRQALLRKLAGQSDEEIAHDLGRSRQAIYNLRHRALQTLLRILDEGNDARDL